MEINLEEIKKRKKIKELLEFSIINIDKPAGPTSFSTDLVIKTALGINKTSHFGTLDPAVTGVLPVALGRACRLMNYFIGKKKTYVGIMRVHKETSEKELNKIIKEFIGEITQLPPVKSRVKREERQRTVYSFKILEHDRNDFLFETEVQAGTYIRKLCDDIGKKIGGAHMLELRRTKASIFEESKSYTIYEFLDAVEKCKKCDEKDLRKMLIPGEIISEVLPIVQIKKEAVGKIYHGSPIFKTNIEGSTPKSEIAAGFYKDRFIGVFKIVNEKGVIAKPEFVLQPINK
ncbi:MAG: RNA-guided pseudouridylation complex pseudouridine synthase subunit Cbf5 [Candidatus Pacearchaeota archaeon]